MNKNNFNMVFPNSELLSPFVNKHKIRIFLLLPVFQCGLGSLLST